jgi:hypothetical protein
MGILGCVLCIVGSTLIVLHAPSERSLTSVEEIWELATQPGKPFGHCLAISMFIFSLLSVDCFHVLGPAFLLYTASAVAVSLLLILYFEPRHGQTNIMVYVGICSIIGSLTVSIPCFFHKKLLKNAFLI